MFNETFLLPTPSNVYKYGHTLRTWRYEVGGGNLGEMSEIPSGRRFSAMGYANTLATL